MKKINTFNCTSCEAIAQMVKTQIAAVETPFDRAANVKSNPIVADSA
jgi:hypothetical protein